MSKYDYSIKTAEVFELPAHRIRQITLGDFQFKARRPRDVSLSSEKVEQYLQVQMPTVGEGLARLKILGRKGWSKALEQTVQCGTSDTGLVHQR